MAAVMMGSRLVMAVCGRPLLTASCTAFHCASREPATAGVCRMTASRSPMIWTRQRVMKFIIVRLTGEPTKSFPKKSGALRAFCEGPNTIAATLPDDRARLGFRGRFGYKRLVDLSHSEPLIPG